MNSDNNQIEHANQTSETKTVIHMKSVRSVGISFDRNPRYRRTMEDAHVALDSFGGSDKQGYFAIYDGHGGIQAVEVVEKQLHKNFEEKLKSTKDVQDAWKESYKLTDEQIAQQNILHAGSTTVTAFIRQEESEDGKSHNRVLYTANVGDARGVLVKSGKAERLTYEHKGSDPTEEKRVSDAGGFVVGGRVNGILAVSRSLGDCAMKDYVTGDPYMQKRVLTDSDTHLILACDGLWDVCEDQQAYDIIEKEEDAKKKSDKLLLHALKSGSTDNISIMVIEL